MADDKVEIFFQAIDRVSDVAEKISSAYVEMVEKLDRAAETIQKGFERSEKATKELLEATKQLPAEMERTRKAAEDQARAEREAAEKAHRLKEEEKALAAEIRKKTTLAQRAGQAVEWLGDRMARAQNRAANFYRRGIQVLNGGFMRMRAFVLGAVAAMALFLGVGGLEGMVRSGTDAVETLDRINFSLRAVTGSQAGATREFQYAYEVADRLGGSLDAAAGSYAKLLAAGKPTGFAIAQVRDIYEATAETATVLGLSNADLEGSLYAVQQMMSKGTISSEELKRQLGERLPGAYAIAAKAMGMTTAALNKQLELGNIYALDFLPKFAAELKRTYGDEVEAAADRFSRHMERMRNRLLFVKDDIARPITEALIPALKDVNEWLDKALEEGKFKRLGERFGDFVTLVHQEWQAGRIDELIGLTIEAGFEIGAKSFQRVFDSKFSASMARIFLKAAVDMFGEFAKMTSDALGFVTLKALGAIGGALHYLADNLEIALKNAFDASLNYWDQITAKLNPFGKDPTPRPMRPFRSYSDSRNDFEMGINDRMLERAEDIEKLTEKLKGYITAEGEGAEKTISALERVKKLLDEIAGTREGDSFSVKIPRPKIDGADNTNATPLKKEHEPISRQELIAAAKLAGYAPSGENGTFVRENQSLLDVSRGRVQGQSLFSSSDGRKFSPTGDTMGGLNDPMEHFQPGLDAIEAKLYDIQAAFGTIGDKIYDLVGGAFDAMGSSIEGLLNGTMNLTGAWSNYGKVLRSTAARAVAEFFQGWIAKRTQAFLVEIGLMKAEEGAKNAASAADKTRALGEAVAWTPAAVIKSIASYGVALAFGAIAIALIGSLMGGGGSSGGSAPKVGATNSYAGASTSVSTPGFADGVVDFRGRGGPREDANLIRISNRESIMTAAATAAYRSPLLAMNAGAGPAQVIAAMGAAPVAYSPTSVPASRGVGDGARNLNILLAYDKADQRRLVRQHGPAVMMDLFRSYGATLGLEA